MIDVDSLPKMVIGGEKKTDEAPADAAAPEGGGELQSIAGELMDAVKAGDSAAVADALKAAFGFLESQPHDEGGE